MLTLRSCFSNKFLTSIDKYLNFTPSYFKLNSLSDDRTFVYVNCVIVIVPEHPIISLHSVKHKIMQLKCSLVVFTILYCTVFVRPYSVGQSDAIA